MREYLILFIFFIGCGNKNQTFDCNEKLRTIEINNILEMIIATTIGSISDNKLLPICTSLKKINIISGNGKDDKHLQINKNSKVNIGKLLRAEANHMLVFEKKDSLGLSSQNYCLQKFDISNKIKTIPLNNIKSLEEYYIVSIPIFSKDNKKAYVEVDFYSKSKKTTMYFYLGKFKATWKVIILSAV